MPNMDNIASDYLTKCFFDLDFMVRTSAERLQPHVDRFDAVVVRGMSGLLVGPMVASLLKKPWCIVRKSGECTHSDHKVVEGWHNFKTYIIIIDDLIASGATVKLIQQTIHDQARAYSENWERGIPECVGIYLFNDTRMAWRGNGKDYSYYDLYFLFQEIPARPNGTEQVTTADCKGQGVLTYAD
jgi:hypothetical protein